MTEATQQHTAADVLTAEQTQDAEQPEQTGQTRIRLWDRDTGTLRKASRTALTALIKGPFVSAENHPANWRALLADTEEIRSRLADMYLDLVVDDERAIAFVRNAETYDDDAPQVVRTSPLTLMDTAMLLHLRRELVTAVGGGRVIIGREEIYEHLHTYRSQVSTDDAGFTKRINSSWKKMENLGILQRSATSSVDGRFEVSPVLRLIFGPEQIEAVRNEYAKLRGAEADADGVPPVEDNGTDTPGHDAETT